jgi:hypothetical protein
MTLAEPAPVAAHERHADCTPAERVQPRAVSVGESKASGETVVVVLADIAPDARAWGYSRFLLGRFALPRMAGLVFSRVLGSGHDGGFGLRPSFSRQGLLCAFASADSAQAFLGSDFVAGFRAHARELLTATLQAYSCRGTWGGRRLDPAGVPPGAGPVAALTRASIRPSRALEFWRKAPPAEVSLASASGCRLAVGLGEAPLLRQATFSLWDSVDAMDAYARTGAHLAAIRASQQGRFFSESMFARFAPLDVRGTWKGIAYA